MVCVSACANYEEIISFFKGSNGNSELCGHVPGNSFHPKIYFSWTTPPSGEELFVLYGKN